MKTSNMYNIRFYDGNKYSKNVGLGKLKPYRKACKIVKRLKKSGINAFSVKIMVNS